MLTENTLFTRFFSFVFNRVKIPGIINFILRLKPIITYTTSLLNINVMELVFSWKLEIFPRYFIIFLMLLVLFFIYIHTKIN